MYSSVESGQLDIPRLRIWRGTKASRIFQAVRVSSSVDRGECRRRQSM